MKRNANLLTSSDMPGHSEHEWHLHEHDDDRCPQASNLRFVYKDGHFGYVANGGVVAFPSPIPHVGPIIAHAQYFEGSLSLSIHPIGVSPEAVQAQLAKVSLSRCEYVRPCVQVFRQLPSFLPVSSEEQPDLTLADKEWIDKIDGHSLRVEDLY